MTDTWAPETAENGTKERAKRVKFGTKPHQTVPHEWAELMLSRLFVKHKRAFGDCLRHASGLEEE